MQAEFEPALGTSAYDALTSTLAIDNSPNGGGEHHGSAYQGSFYGYVSKDLRTTLGEQGARASTRAATAGRCATCRTALRDSLAAALKVPASTVYGGDERLQGRGQGRRPVCFDAVRQRPTGGATQPLIDWINRPTFQQAVEIPKHLPR